MPDAVQGAAKHRQPSLVGEGLGDVRLGVAHQALGLLTRRVDVGAVDRVRLPAPAVAVVGQPDGPAACEDGGAPRSGAARASRTKPSGAILAQRVFRARTAVTNLPPSVNSGESGGRGA